MNKTATVINIIVALLVVAYLVVARVYYDQRSGLNLCTDIKLDIVDGSPYEFVNDSIVMIWIEQSKIKIIGVPVSEIDKYAVETELKEHQYIDSIQVYTTMTGDLNIRLTQNIPLVRIKADNGYDFYVDSTLKILPIETHFRAEVPILSGSPQFHFSTDHYGHINDEKYAKDREYLKKVINFVESLYGDEFLANLIVQIYVNQQGDVELVPRIGEQLIVLGTLDDYIEKLDKLKKFYKNSFFEQWWTKAKVVNLKYKQQVIVS